MSGVSFGRRYWASLVGGDPAPVPPPRAREGVALWQRYWASLTGKPLRLSYGLAAVAVPVVRDTRREAPAKPGIETLTDALSSATGAVQRRTRAASLIAAIETRREHLTDDLAARVTALLLPLGGEDRFLTFAIDRALARIRGEDVPSGLRVETRFAMAAGEDNDHGRVRVARGPVQLTAALTRDGRLRVGAGATLDMREAESIARTYGTMFLPIRVTDESGSVRVWMVLRAGSGDTHGELSLPEPVGAHVTVDLDGLPAGSAEIADRSGEELVRSLTAVTTRHDLASWEAIARDLPNGHPLRQALDS
ncbi:hypothetical protein [Streptosporangium sp. CA-115845]|uniref:hypothetical protein n=1 Tax=Streptosporangium sp. CA-115845 TaxID=3240071 RepID=UPI003D93CF09